MCLRLIVVVQQSPGDQIAKVYADFTQDLALLFDNVDAFGLQSTASFYAAELALEAFVEFVDAFFRPLDDSRRRCGWKRGRKGAEGVQDKREGNVGEGCEMGR